MALVSVSSAAIGERLWIGCGRLSEWNLKGLRPAVQFARRIVLFVYRDMR